MVSGEPDGSKRIAFDFTVTIEHANYPFPPDETPLRAINVEDLTDKSSLSMFDVALSSTLDTFVTSYSISIVWSDVEPFQRYYQGCLSVLLIKDEAKWLDRSTIRKAVNYAATWYYADLTVHFPIPKRVEAADVLRLQFTNASGQTISAEFLDATILYFMGS